eukprot:362352_1
MDTINDTNYDSHAWNSTHHELNNYDAFEGGLGVYDDHEPEHHYYGVNSTTNDYPIASTMNSDVYSMPRVVNEGGLFAHTPYNTFSPPPSSPSPCSYRSSTNSSKYLPLIN